MPLPTPKPPTADGNPPEYNAMNDLAERCAKAEAELERVKIERDEAYVARDFADAALERVQKQAAAMREALSRIDARVRVSEIMPDAGWVMSLTADALQPNAGSDYIRRDQALTCFSCRDGNTPLYCLNCAWDILKNKAQSQLDAMAAVVKSAYVHKDEVRKLVECLEWVHMGSICGDPATSASSRKDCPICKALNHAKSLGL